MKSKLLLSFVLTFAICVNAFAQTDPVIMTIAGDNVTRTEFEKVFKKNNTKETNFSKKEVTEYVDLFINYKLKVREAIDLGMDTITSFRNELAGYRKQLAQPYLVDKSVTDSLLKEAYTRMQKEVRASHILIKCTPDALPKDTLEAYNKAMRIRTDLLKGGDFVTITQQKSDDPSAKENGGDLGYFTALQMVYPFENVAYTTPVGQVSMPVRTRFGYHIIKVTDQRPAQGEVKVAHIMVKTAANISEEDSLKAVTKINEIYDKLKAGEKFEAIAKQYSDDQGSAKNGGALPMFGTGRMVPEFESAAFSLKNVGDYTAPVKTAYGWHIIKLLEKKPIVSYEDMQGELKNKVSKDSRSELSKTSKVNKIKKQYGYKETLKAKDEFLKTVDSTLVEGKWSADKADKLKGSMFTLGGQAYSAQDFAKYVVDHQVKRTGGSAKQLASSLYTEWVNESAIAYEESQLDKNYPEFKSLMQEYRDGILLFELTDEKVWSKAVKDTAGLQAFYQKNKNNYMWPDRLDAMIFTCANKDIAKQLRKMLKKGLAPDSIVNTINKGSQLNLQVRPGKFIKGDNEIIDSIPWVAGITPDIMRNEQIVIVDVKAVLPAQPKSLDEAKGIITADYQSYLEKEWIDSLRKKYPVTVNQEVVSTLGN